MKYSLVALAATSIFGGALAAHGHHHHRRHDNVPHDTNGECVPPEVPAPCTTIVTSYLVPVDHHPSPPPPPPVIQETYVVTPIEETTTYTETHQTTEYTTATSTTVIEIPHGEVPTPEVTTYPTPGTYTIPEKTLTVTSTEYLCAPETTDLPPGTHTLGGVTTVVEHQTTVVCPVAVTETIDETITSKVVMTTYVCPTPGTYTIAPITTTITATTVVGCEYPTVTSYDPGVYTRPEETITITKTNEVYVCPTYEHVLVTETVVPVPEETYAPAPEEEEEEQPYPEETYTPTPEEEETPVEETPVEETPVEETPVEETPVEETPVEETLVEETPEKETPVDLPTGGSGPSWAITYSPYNDDRTCKTKEQVAGDIKDIASKGFKNIRLYSSDCGSLDTVLPHCATYEIKVIFGIFIRDSSCNADEDLDRILAWKKWEHVTMFVVGNEALFQGFCQPEQFAGYITEVTKKLRDNGYTGPVTTTEPLNIIEQHYKVICPVLDVVSLNVHPYFNPEVEAKDAGPFLNAQLKRAEELCGKTGYVLEAGWPSSGNTNGKAIASPGAQQDAFKSLLSNCPTERICLFTWRNDYWKSPGGFNVEQNFGCGTLF